MPILRKSVLIPAALVVAAIASTPSIAQTAQQKQKMKDCLLIDDGYKERLDCYDAVIAPEPKSDAKKAKVASDCRFQKEQDQRLACFNGFVDPKKRPQPAGKTAKNAPLPK